MKRIKSIVLLTCLPLYLVANAPLKQDKQDNANISNNIIESASLGERVITPETMSNINNTNGGNIYYVETILNWHYFFNQVNPRAKEVVGTAKPFVVALKPEDNNATQPTEEAKKLLSVKGYCYIPEFVGVGKQPASLLVDCETNVGSIKMFANLVNVNEKASLVADPKYIERRGVRFLVESSIVTNENRTSYNIATYVDDRKVSEVAYSALSLGSDEFKTASNEYLKALEDSKKKQSVEYVTITDGAGNSYMQPVQTTNTEKPDPLDYLIKAGINVVSSSVKAFADLNRKDLPYLYEIYPQTKIWVDLKVNTKGEYVK